MKLKTDCCILLLFMTISSSCKKNEQVENTAFEENVETLGSIEIMDQEARNIIDEDTQIEILASGFEWTEGPLWIEDGDYVLFSDIPVNSIFKWKESEGLSLFLEPSGYTGATERGGEMGSNGLLLNSEGQLVLCQHGDRRIAVLNTNLDKPLPQFSTLIGDYNGKRLNSPNDAIYTSNGDLYFTDPPYGLEKNMEDPEKELGFQGVYLYRSGEEAVLLTDALSRPNGIALSPDEKILYVANSDPESAMWMAFDRNNDGTIDNARIFYDATILVGQEGEQGLPDGLKVNKEGIIFATGPGGVWIFDPQGTPMAKIRTGQLTSNCALSSDEKTLYVTADMHLLRVRLE